MEKFKKAPKMKSIPDSVKRPKEEIAAFDNKTYNPQPYLSLNEDVLPEIKNWKVGNKYILQIEVEMKGIRIETYGHHKDKTCAEFNITKIGING